MPNMRQNKSEVIMSEPRPSGYICRDFGRPGCCSIPDTRYTMRFDDIGEEPIYWCTHCGKQSALILRSLSVENVRLKAAHAALVERLKELTNYREVDAAAIRSILAEWGTGGAKGGE